MEPFDFEEPYEDDSTITSSSLVRDLEGEPDLASLVLFIGDQVEVRTLAVGDSLVIGRSAPATLIVPDRRLSREHARFEHCEDGLWVEDRRSTNGTRVNGRTVDRVRLHPHDKVTMPGVTVVLNPGLTEDVSTPHSPEIEDEMEAARDIQNQLVGSSERVELDGLEIAGFYRPASICGGDFWNYFTIDRSRTLVVVGDVTGHGMPTVMMSATAKACCDTICATQGENVSVAQLMAALNTAIFDSGRGRVQMTLFATLIDTERSMAQFANAGHPAPFVCRRDAGHYSLHSLAGRGMRLGDTRDASFRVHETRLAPQDVLVWFTDGLIESTDAAGRPWGERGLRRSLLAYDGQRVDELRDRLVDAAYRFYGGVALDDDVTLVVGKLAR